MPKDNAMKITRVTFTALFTLSALSALTTACDEYDDVADECLDVADECEVQARRGVIQDLRADSVDPGPHPVGPQTEAAPEGCDPRDPDACAEGYECIYASSADAFFCTFAGTKDDDTLSPP